LLLTKLRGKNKSMQQHSVFIITSAKVILPLCLFVSRTA